MAPRLTCCSGDSTRTRVVTLPGPGDAATAAGRRAQRAAAAAAALACRGAPLAPLPRRPPFQHRSGEPLQRSEERACSYRLKGHQNEPGPMLGDTLAAISGDAPRRSAPISIESARFQIKGTFPDEGALTCRLLGARSRSITCSPNPGGPGRTREDALVPPRRAAPSSS